jgi:hypothetical protein
MKKDSTFAVIGLLIVLSPLIILAIHHHNTVERFATEQSAEIIRAMSTFLPKAEHFAASQGGALIQLATSHVASEAEVAENLRQEKRQVVGDILNMTEPEKGPGPRPAFG